MEKNIFLCHGDSFLFREIISKISSSEKNTNFIGIFVTGEKDKILSSKTHIFTLQDFIKNQEKYMEKNNLTISEINYFRKECFYDFMSQTDRLSKISISSLEKIKLFDLFLNYFLNYFRKNKITNVVFHTTPHLAFDFIFFHIANYLKIKKTIFFRTYYEDITMISEDYRKKYFSPIINDDKNNNIEILKRNISVWGKLGVSINKNSVNTKNINGLFLFFLNLIKRLKYTYLDKQLQSFNLLNKNNNFIIFVYLHFLHLFRTFKLKKKYKSICKKPDLTCDYVFFAMHNQPEKTTNPEGEEFDNQINAIKLIRNVVDKKIKIYVKEHPKQLNPFTADVRQLNSRTIHDYNLIKNLENCELIDINIDTKSIIKNSKINFTISGTLAWQSLLENVPSITFSNTWHSSCKASPVINNDMNRAKEQVNDLIRKDEKQIFNDLKIFESEIKNKLFFTSISEFEIKKSSNKEDHLKTNLYNAMLSSLK